MDILLLVLPVAIAIVGLVCYSMITIAAFKERLMYGFMCLFCCGLGGIVYGIMRSSELKKPLFGLILCNIASIFLQFYTAGFDFGKMLDMKGAMEQEQELEMPVAIPEVESSAAAPDAAPAAPGPASFEVEPGPAGNGSARPAPGASGNAPEAVVKGVMDESWQAASELLKIGGVMKNSIESAAIVNNVTLGLNEEAAVSVAGQVYRFKITGIDVDAKRVEFIPVGN
ncbi:MAG: hypothetical protein GX608_10800 [Lentisphaerae bacterium]|nr:hypothetical protein [Lentisphaerota bacterium]